MLKILTPNGYSKFDGIRKVKRDKSILFKLETTDIRVTLDHIFVVDNTSIKAQDLKVNDCLDTVNGKEHITSIELINEEDYFYDILETDNHLYYANGIVNHNCSFIGSSHTLVSSESLSKMSFSDPIAKWDGKLNVYKEPKTKHSYFLGCDPAKSGSDALAVQIIDITKFPFEQVATAQLFKENFQIMPEFLYEWSKRYNNAYTIIENNEGAGTFINTLLHTEFDDCNLFFDRIYNRQNPLGKQSKESGWRTNKKNRKQILDTLKLFVDNDKLIIHDKETINELQTFIEKNGKYQADDGCHDDMVMSLAITFAPFCNTRNFSDMRKLINKLYKSQSEEDDNFTDYIVVGNFDSADDFSIYGF